MKRGLLWGALVLSLLFNVFFASGFARAMLAGDPAGATGANGDAAAARVSDALGLDPAQEAMFASLRRDVETESKELQDTLALARADLVEALSDEAPDPDRLRAIARRGEEHRRDHRDAVWQRFQVFVETLEPEQRRRLGAMLHGGPGGRPRRGIPPHLIEQFDADGDGALNDAERAAAWRHHQEMREQRRQERLERFDADGSGDLDDAERDAMREAMRARRQEEILERFDTNGDGELDEAEKRAMPEPRGPRGPRGMRGRGGNGGGPGRGGR